MKYDWTKFTMRIPIEKNKSDVFKTWSSQKGIESWFLRKALYFDNGKQIPANQEIKKGNTFRWNWYMNKYTEDGTILDVKKDQLVSFTFVGSVVTVKLKSQGKFTFVELTQDHIPLDEESKVQIHLGCSTGWTYHLTNLKSMLENRKDLRNKKFKKVFNN